MDGREAHALCVELSLQAPEGGLHHAEGGHRAHLLAARGHRVDLLFHPHLLQRLQLLLLRLQCSALQPGRLGSLLGEVARALIERLLSTRHVRLARARGEGLGGARLDLLVGGVGVAVAGEQRKPHVALLERTHVVPTVAAHEHLAA